MTKQALINARDYVNFFHGPPLQIVSDCLRGHITAAPGNRLIGVDLSQIEARVLNWLAGQEDKLELFRQGKDIYLNSASAIYGIPEEEITSEQRLIGKVSELALGYQGGYKAFQSMAKNYLVKIENQLAEDIKVKWRAANTRITEYWFRLEDAATAALKNPGASFHVGKKGRHITYTKRGSFLCCVLPSGRTIYYPYPKMALVTTPWGDKKHAITYKGEVMKKWIRQSAYGGLLAENITQAVSRDILRDAMHRWERHGYPVVLHVHDELVAEVPLNSQHSLKHAEQLMCEIPHWAQDLPIAAEGWEGKRFRK